MIFFRVTNLLLFLLFLEIICSQKLFSQNIFINNGANVVSTGNLYMHVGGGVLNQSGGTFDNSGIINLYGDWENNSGNAGFINSSPGKVKLLSSNQVIRGTDVTNFYDLILMGTGIKSLENIDAIVEDSLVINDLEFSTDINTLFVTNSSTGILTRTIGFVSSLNNGGLSRNTSALSNYLYPVGSSIGTVRYRPVEIRPTSSSANTFKVRMANTDATTEGFDRSNKDSSLCLVNPDFYHRIWKTFGNDSANISIYFDNTIDGNYTKIGHWQNIPQWENTGVVVSSLNASPILSYLTKQNWNDFSFPAFSLATEAPLAAIVGDTAICFGVSANLTASGGSTYIWSDGSTTSSINVNPTSTTTYVVTASNSGCSNTASINVSVNNLTFVNAGPDVTINIGESIQLNATGGFSYLWTPSTALSCINCPNPVASPLNSTTYYLTSMNSTGCINYDTLTVFVDSECGEVFVPTAFSPNGDNENDVLYVRGTCISDMNFAVFDRWGEKVFESTDKLLGWDGSFKGSPMNTQVFVFYLTANMYNGEIVKKQGNISLIK